MDRHEIFVVHKMITGAAFFLGLMVVVELRTLAKVTASVVTMVSQLRKTVASYVITISMVDMTAKVQGHAAVVQSVTAEKSVDVKIYPVVAALAVGRAKVNVNKNEVVAVGLMLAAMVVLSVMVAMQVVGVVVLAALKVLKTKTRMFVAVLAVGRAALMMITHAVVVVSLTMTGMEAVQVKVKISVMRFVVQAVEEVLKMITGAAVVVGRMLLVEMWTVSNVRTVVVKMAIELCTRCAWRGGGFTLIPRFLFVPMWGTAFVKSVIPIIALLQPRPEHSVTLVLSIEA